jgi:hypothetical protein
MTEVTTKELIRLRKEDGKTYTEIAKLTGLTKNTIIGRIWRSQGGDRKVYDKVTRASKPRAKRKSKDMLKLVSSTPPTPAIPEEGLLIYQLEAGQCKYAIGNAPDGQHLFCAQPTDRVYCDKHHVMCNFMPPGRKKNIT